MSFYSDVQDQLREGRDRIEVVATSPDLPRGVVFGHAGQILDCFGERLRIELIEELTEEVDESHFRVVLTRLSQSRYIGIDPAQPGPELVRGVQRRGLEANRLIEYLTNSAPIDNHVMREVMLRAQEEMGIGLSPALLADLGRFSDAYRSPADYSISAEVVEDNELDGTPELEDPDALYERFNQSDVFEEMAEFFKANRDRPASVKVVGSDGVVIFEIVNGVQPVAAAPAPRGRVLHLEDDDV